LGHLSLRQKAQESTTPMVSRLGRWFGWLARNLAEKSCFGAGHGTTIHFAAPNGLGKAFFSHFWAENGSSEAPVSQQYARPRVFSRVSRHLSTSEPIRTSSRGALLGQHRLWGPWMAVSNRSMLPTVTTL
jgi:hypothetical protein